MKMKKSNVASKAETATVVEEPEKEVPNIVVDNSDVTQDTATVSTETVNKALRVVSETFGLGNNYSVSSFADKGSTVKIGLSSTEFDIDVVIKKPYDCHVKNFE